MGHTAKGIHSFEMVWCGKYIGKKKNPKQNLNGVERASWMLSAGYKVFGWRKFTFAVHGSVSSFGFKEESEYDYGVKIINVKTVELAEEERHVFWNICSFMGCGEFFTYQKVQHFLLWEVPLKEKWNCEQSSECCFA